MKGKESTIGLFLSIAHNEMTRSKERLVEIKKPINKKRKQQKKNKKSKKNNRKRRKK